MDKLTVTELKQKAEKAGIKVKGEGWAVCCPPKGRKKDIIKALNSKKKHRRKASSPKRNAAPQMKTKRRVQLTSVPAKPKRRISLVSTTTSDEWSRDQCLLKCKRFMTFQDANTENPFTQMAAAPKLTEGQKRYKKTLDSLEQKYSGMQENNPEWEIAELQAELLDPDLTEDDREWIEEQIAELQDYIG